MELLFSLSRRALIKKTAVGLVSVTLGLQEGALTFYTPCVCLDGEWKISRSGPIDMDEINLELFLKW